MEESNESLWKRQVIPLILTLLVCAILIAFLWIEVHLLNNFMANKIVMQVNWVDVLVGMTIYLKTSIDFALYIGMLMAHNKTWKGRIAIEIGTALGNAAGTMGVLVIWAFFKEVRWLLAVMILFASLVLFTLAEESLEHVEKRDGSLPKWFQWLVENLQKLIEKFNYYFRPVLRYVLPKIDVKSARNLPFWGLFAISFTVPFVLGLDDFAGYVPLFNVVNVLGFAIGVMVGHMLLNIFLYLSPNHTIKVVKNVVISFLGSLVFIGLGIWGLVEVVRVFWG